MPTAAPSPEKCSVGLRTGWLNVTVIVPRPVHAPVAAHVPAFTVRSMEESPVTMFVGVYVAAVNPLCPRVLTPVSAVLPVAATVAVSPDGIVRTPPAVHVPVVASYATALGLAPNVRTLTNRTKADSHVSAR